MAANDEDCPRCGPGKYLPCANWRGACAGCGEFPWIKRGEEAHMPPTECQHRSHHRVDAEVVYMADSGRFALDVRLYCADCDLPFRFIGLPAGVDLNGAAVSVDATEARLAVAPRGEVISALEGGQPSGFSVRRMLP